MHSRTDELAGAPRLSQIGSAVAADGTRLAYRVYGDPRSPCTLILTNGYSTSSFYWRHVIERLADKVRLVTWDLKGHGDSGPARDLNACTIADCADDLRRVMDAVRVERAVVVGFSLGCQIVLEAWRNASDRIAAIVPILGTYERPFDGLLHPRFGAMAATAFAQLGPYLGAGGLRLTERLNRRPIGHRLNQVLGIMSRDVPFETMRSFYEHLGRIHPPTWVAMGVAAQRHSARDLLPTIEVPVLVISGGKDVWTPPARSDEMQRLIPRCERLDIPEATHTGLYEAPGVICERLLAFLRDHRLLDAQSAVS